MGGWKEKECFPSKKPKGTTILISATLGIEIKRIFFSSFLFSRCHGYGIFTQEKREKKAREFFLFHHLIYPRYEQV
jgi:hypothetical protein